MTHLCNPLQDLVDYRDRSRRLARLNAVLRGLSACDETLTEPEEHFLLYGSDPAELPIHSALSKAETP